MKKDIYEEEINKILNAEVKFNIFLGFYYKSKDIQYFQEIINHLNKQNKELKDYLKKINRNPLLDGFSMESFTRIETEELMEKTND